MNLTAEEIDELRILLNEFLDAITPPIPQCDHTIAIYRDPGGLMYQLQCLEESGHKNKHSARYEDTNNIRYRLYWDNSN